MADPAAAVVMTRLLAAVRREPVRAYLYGLLGPAAGLAVTYGAVSQNKAALWVALGGAVLVPGAAELARRKVTPTRDPRTPDGRPAEIVTAYAPGEPWN